MANPTPGTQMVAHAVVGVAAGAVAHAVARKVPITVATVLAALFLHYVLDAPVAQFLANIGLQF
jgi:hypothetical protein